MTAAWELVRGARGAPERRRVRRHRADGILLAGRGLAVDRVVADFVAGAAEALVLDARREAITS
jgi:uncharacterized NAD-dependent epimerase/dehydratase family protein